MKRFHVHMAVEKLDTAVTFYQNLFGQAPTLLKSDYAKWMLDDPRVNFAISSRGRPAGLDHLGIQAENKDELKEVYGRMDNAGHMMAQGETACCYAQSEKSWVHDPHGVAWEAFHTVGESTTYGDADLAASSTASACCVPLAPSSNKEEACCVPTPADGKSPADGSCC